MKGRFMGIVVALVAALALGEGTIAAGAAEGGALSLAGQTGQDLAAYQVFCGSLEEDGSLADIGWGSGVDAEGLLAELNATTVDGVAIFEDSTDAREVAQVIGSPQEGVVSTEAAKALARAAIHHLTEGHPFSGREAGSVTEPLEDGYYLVASVPTDGSAARTLVFPALVAVGAGDTTLTLKEAAPSLQKQVFEDSSGTWGSIADAEAGQDVPFRVSASLPDTLFECERLSCRIVDELPQGLELNRESITVTCGDIDVSDLFELRLEGSTLTLEAAELVGAGLPNDCTIVLAYTARLTSASPVGGSGSINAARLEIGADGQSLSTPEAKTALFTYRLVLTKVDAANHSAALAGASFVLSREDGHYAIVSDGCVQSWTKDINHATELTTGSDGKLSVAGLDSDSYTLRETKAPSGYSAYGSDIPLSIQSELSFDLATEEGRIDALRLSSGSASSQGDAASGSLFCSVENAQTAAQAVPSTGDREQGFWVFALAGAFCSVVALCAGKSLSGAKRLKDSFPSRFAACLFVAFACVFAHIGCLPLPSLAEEASELVISGSGAAEEQGASTELVIGSGGAKESNKQVSARSGLKLGASPNSATRVAREADMPRSSSNSYINILNMSYENAYVMVNDTTNFAYSGTSPCNTYINWSFGPSGYAGSYGQQITRMVLYQGAAGVFGANEEMFGVDKITDTTGKGLVAIWFKDAGVLSDTGEPVSMLLKLKSYQILPNYEDLFVYQDGEGVHESKSTYRSFIDSGRGGVPLLYICKADGLDQTNPSNARVWMNAVWQSGQTWEISFYRSSQVPTIVSDSSGYSLDSLNLSGDLLVSKAANGEYYLARQYCYDLDVTGIRWLDPLDGSYSPTSEYASPISGTYGLGGAYFVSSGAESFAWVSGTASSSYISTASNLKTDSDGNLTYWLHDYDSPEGGVWNVGRWESSASSGNVDWRNALAADILPQSSFAWVGTGCSTGINLNSQFTGTGTLQISKTIDDGSNTAFPFRINLESPTYSSGAQSWTQLSGSYSYTVKEAGGNTVSSGTLSSGNTVSLAAGQTLVVSGIPEGTRFTVVETSHAGYQPTQETSTGIIVADEFVGTIVNGQTNEVDIKNVKLFAPADWEIVKKGPSGERLSGAEFTIRYYVGASASGTPTRTWVIKSDGEGKAKLDAAHLVSGDEFYLDVYGNIGIPVGTLTVEETRAPEGYERDSEVRTYRIDLGQNGITSTIPATLEVVNELLTGSLAVTKRLQGNGADANRNFVFSLRLTREGTPLSGTFGGLAFTDGLATFSLKAGQTKTVTGIPRGTDFELSEAAAAGYSVSWENRTGTIAANSTVTATATNTYEATGTAQLSLTKLFDTNGDPLKEGQFAFELHKESPEGQLVATSECAADGSVLFELTFDQDSIGHSYTYYVTEVNDGQSGVSYDTHAARVVVSVTDNGDGTLGTDVSYSEATFTNTFRKYVLPSTGFGGVVGALALGVTLTAGAATTITRVVRGRRRRR